MASAGPVPSRRPAPTGPVAAGNPTADPPTTGPVVPSTLPGWTLVDYDDFNGDRVDDSRWGVYRADATNGISKWLPSMVTVGGGELRIAGTGRNPTGEGNVSGGLCWCKDNGSRTYGMWQVRARFEKGVGFGQAILLWPQSERWPEDGELDFVETPFGSKTTAVGTIHWGTTNHEDGKRVTGDYTAWHTYAVQWRSGSVKMLIDDVVYYDSSTSSKHPDIPQTPMHLAIQQEPGPFGDNWVPPPDASTPDQVTMHIDWVRIYS
jgi:beta-glucanase (GH16 family)